MASERKELLFWIEKYEKNLLDSKDDEDGEWFASLIFDLLTQLQELE